MKDTHNVILIIVSSKWSSFFFPELFIMSHFSVQDASSFLFRSSKFSALSRRVAPPKSLQGFTLCCQLLFLFIILLLPKFFMEALHDGSSRIPFILHLFFKISLEVMICQAILKNKHGAQHMFVLRSSSILHLAFRSANSFFRIIGGGIMSFLMIWVYVS